MTALTHEDRVALVDSVRRLLADRCTETDVRRVMDSGTGHDPDLWRALADMGVPGLAIAPEHGGAGLGPVELGLVMEEAGAALLPSPLLSCVTAAALLAAGDATDLLAGIADGSRIMTVAFAGAADWTARDGVVVVDGRASGTARFVTDAAIADTILLATDEGVYLPLHAPRVAPLPVFDRTRRMADVTFDGEVRRVGDAAAVRAALDLAVVALAGEQAGVARRVLEMTVGYAAERHQFGRAIGSFQAIKHMAADLLLESESATSAARDAAEQLAAGSREKDAAVALAAFACADAAVRCTKDAIQMHGGIAFTWAHPAHLYLRRARSAAQLFGAPPLWRDRYLTALEAMA